MKSKEFHKVLNALKFMVKEYLPVPADGWDSERGEKMRKIISDAENELKENKKGS